MSRSGHRTARAAFVALLSLGSWGTALSDGAAPANVTEFTGVVEPGGSGRGLPGFVQSAGPAVEVRRTVKAAQTDKRRLQGELARRIAAGDRAAEGELYALFRPVLRLFLVRWLGNDASAEEQVHDTFEVALPLLRSGIDDPDAVGALLLGIARNRVRNHDRRRREQALDDDGDAWHPPDPAPGPEDRARAEERDRRLVAFLDRLAPVQRDVLRREFHAHQDRHGIAEALGLSPQAVSNHRHRALEKLRGLLAEDALREETTS
jgi:RNA polymerase sigma factor (sigma-70 family)